MANIEQAMDSAWNAEQTSKEAIDAAWSKWQQSQSTTTNMGGEAASEPSLVSSEQDTGAGPKALEPLHKTITTAAEGMKSSFDTIGEALKNPKSSAASVFANIAGGIHQAITNPPTPTVEQAMNIGLATSGGKEGGEEEEATGGLRGLPPKIATATKEAVKEEGKTDVGTGINAGLSPEEERGQVQSTSLQQGTDNLNALSKKLASAREGDTSTMTHAEMVKAAGGVDPKTFSGAVLEQGHLLNASHQIALTDHLTQMGQQISDEATDIARRAADRGIKIEDIPPEDSQHLFDRMHEFADAHGMESQLATDSGRVTNAMALTKAAREAHDQVSENLQTHVDDPEFRARMIRAWACMKHPAQVAKLNSDVVHDISDGESFLGHPIKKLANYVQNAGLYNPALPVRKFITDNVAMYEQPLIDALQGKLHQMAPSLVSDADADGATEWHELMAPGLLHHFAEQIHVDRQSWKSRTPYFSTNDNGKINSMGSEDDDMLQTGAGMAAHYTGFGTTGKRMAMAMTEGPAAQMERMNLAGLARKRAMDFARKAMALETPSGVQSVDDARRQVLEDGHFQELMNQSPRALVAQARQRALGQLYLNKPNEIGQRIEGLRQSLGAVGRIGLTYFRVPWNIGMNEYAHTPLGFSGLLPGRLRNGANVAKATAGLAGVGLAAYAHYKGVFTGAGPNEPKARADWLVTHHPYSLKIGKHQFDMSMIPVPGLRKAAMLTGDFLDTWPQQDPNDARDLASRIGQFTQNVCRSGGIALGRSVVDDPYLNWLEMWSHIHDYASGQTNGQVAAEHIEKLIAGKLIPPVLKNGDLTDDYERQTDQQHGALKGMIDAVQSKLPFFSRRLDPVLDEYGNRKHYMGGYSDDEMPSGLDRVANMVSPARISSVPTNPMTYEVTVEKLKTKGYNGGGSLISEASRATPWYPQHDKYEVDLLAGKLKHAGFDNLTTGSNKEAWDNMTEVQQARKLSSLNSTSNLRAIKAYESQPEKASLKIQRKAVMEHKRVFRMGAGPAIATGGPQ